MSCRVGKPTKIMSVLNIVPPMAKRVEAGFDIPWLPKLKISVISKVNTLFSMIHAVADSTLTKRPIMGILSALKNVDQPTNQSIKPASMLDCAVGVRVI